MPVRPMNRGLRSTRAGASGFTLLELLVVLVLAAVAVTIVGGSAQSFMARAQYHQAVREVASQLGQARSLCVQEGRSVVVSYEPQARQLTIDGQHPVRVPDAVGVSWNAVEQQQPDESWGWIIGQGAKLIQTDRPALLIEYLKEKGFHN